MNPGDLRQRIIFFMDDVVDEDGYPIPGEAEYTKAWAELKTLTGRTFYEAAKSNLEHNREFRIRYQKKLEDTERPPNVKVKWKGITHDIESIENVDGLNKEMLVRCKAVT